jgi:hypothetical protein
MPKFQRHVIRTEADSRGASIRVLILRTARRLSGNQSFDQYVGIESRSPVRDVSLNGSDSIAPTEPGQGRQAGYYVQHDK